MKFEIQIAPRNSLVLIMDQSVGQVPESMNDELVAATSSCIAVGTLCEIDGDTRITLSDSMPSDEPDLVRVFDGVLETPRRKLAVCSVLDKPLLAMDLHSDRTRVCIWTNHEREPNKIHVVATRN